MAAADVLPGLDLGTELPRWLTLKENRAFPHHQEVARFLLDFYDAHLQVQGCPLEGMLAQPPQMFLVQMPTSSSELTQLGGSNASTSQLVQLPQSQQYLGSGQVAMMQLPTACVDNVNQLAVVQAEPTLSQPQDDGAQKQEVMVSPQMDLNAALTSASTAVNSMGEYAQPQRLMDAKTAVSPEKRKKSGTSQTPRIKRPRTAPKPKAPKTPKQLRMVEDLEANVAAAAVVAQVSNAHADVQPQMLVPQPHLGSDHEENLHAETWVEAVEGKLEEPVYLNVVVEGTDSPLMQVSVADAQALTQASGQMLRLGGENVHILTLEEMGLSNLRELQTDQDGNILVSQDPQVHIDLKSLKKEEGVPGLAPEDHVDSGVTESGFDEAAMNDSNHHEVDELKVSGEVECDLATAKLFELNADQATPIETMIVKFKGDEFDDIQPSDLPVTCQLVCSDCLHVFASFKKFSSHREKRAHDGQHWYCCARCLRSHPNLEEFKSHQEQCEQTSPVKQDKRKRDVRKLCSSCPQCPWVGPSSNSLRTHIMEHLNQRFLCDKCPYTTKDYKQFSDHKYISHVRKEMPKRKIMCEICGKQYEPGILNRHIRTVHEKLLLYQCKLCDKKCTNKSSLQIHQEVHSNLRTIMCPAAGCHMSFKHKRHLGPHIRRKHKNVIFTLT